MPKVLSAVRALLFGSAGSQAVALGVSGDNNPRLRIDAGGRLTWGTGAAAGDIYVERSGVNSLLVSGEVLADSYQVDVAATPTGAIGKLIWNDTEGTLDLGLKGGNVTLPVGQSLTQRVSNVTGASMARGKAVYLTGAQGNRTTVGLARANTESTSSKTFGITSEAISDSGSGFVITEGLLAGLDTSALTEGSIVWLSAATAGALTTTRPTAPNHGVMIGLCVRSHASAGILLVKVQNGYELEELHNVSISTPTDGQVLTYDAALTLWKNANSAGGGGASVSVGDTAPASPSEGDLWFNSSNLKTYIYYDSFWVEVGGGAGGGGQYTVSDTAPSAPGTGDVWYDSTTGKQYIYYDLFWVEMTTSNALSVAGHTTTHIRGGSDIIDGDQLQVDYVPSAYTRNSAASGAGAVTDLSAHLSGIDNKFADIALTSYTPTLAQGASTNISKSVAFARYMVVGKTMYLWVRLFSTGTGTAGSPITVSIPAGFTLQNGDGFVGSGAFGDSGVGDYMCFVYAQTSTTLSLVASTTTSGAKIGVTPAITVAVNDGVNIHAMIPIN